MSIWCQGPCTVIGFACVAQAQYFKSIAADSDVLRRAAAKVRSPEAETAQRPMGVVSWPFFNRSVGPMIGWGQTRSWGDVHCMTVLPPKAEVDLRSSYVAQVPCVDGSELARAFFTSQAWSVQPCVRPVCAVYMTAGHNALRGSGPGQNLAFDNALARVGCPDRRIDRLSVACASFSCIRLVDIRYV
jgi:hypothetical protein